ncbi:hypothetical protein H9P43_006508 [Blastocladiella emersonii ATCC 22665]|nr:hypothetical protein H9P43_006508 [Blastocladiella emersonii ATCC 22665]
MYELPRRANKRKSIEKAKRAADPLPAGTSLASASAPPPPAHTQTQKQLKRKEKKLNKRQLKAALAAATGPQLDDDVATMAPSPHSHPAAAAAAAAPAFVPGPPKPYLVILDLNGCLIARPSKEEHARARKSPHGLPFRVASVARKPVYLRPHLAGFARVLAENPRLDFAVWTSAAPENAAKLIELSLGEDFARRLRFVWGRNKCTADDRNPDKPWATLKDLRNVFHAHPEYAPERTVIVDDSMYKCRLNPDNAVVLPQWDLADHSRSPLDDAVLLDLAAYLHLLARASPTDVREWIRPHPFSIPQLTPGAAAGDMQRVRFVSNPAWNFVAPPSPPPAAAAAPGTTADGTSVAAGGLEASVSLPVSGSWVDLCGPIELVMDGDDEDAYWEQVESETESQAETRV